MDYNTSLSKVETTHLLSIIKKDFRKKYPLSDFDFAYKNYERIKEFKAIGNIYDSEDSKYLSEEVHYIMRLIAQYHINQALKALKYDTTNDVNLCSNDEDGNIGTPGRIAKLWAGSKLDSDSLSELGDGRWVKKPRIASFPIERNFFKGTFITDSDNKIIFLGEENNISKKYRLTTTPIGDRVEPALEEEESKTTYLIDLNNKDFNIEYLLEENTKYKLDIDKLLKAGEITIACISNKKREIIKKTIFNIGVGSTCSHHFLPYLIIGKETNSKIVIAYKAYKDNIGISKITKMVKWLAKRPSLQEELTELIASEIQKITGSNDILVGFYGMMHTCEVTRGSSVETSTTTEHAEGLLGSSEVLRNSLYSKG